MDLRFSKEKVTEYLTHAKTSPVRAQVDDILFSIQEIEEYRDYTDFLILSAAKRMGHSLLTFDERLKRHANRHGVRTL